MKQADQIIELSPFKSSRDSSYNHACPYAIFFVYTPDKFVLVKGMSEEVRKYVETNLQRSVFNYTYWKNGIWRGGWSSWLKIYFSIEKNGFDKRHYQTISMVTADGYKNNCLKVRRIPRRWLPIYEQALPRGSNE